METLPTASNPTTPEPLDYVNPLETSSRWYLNARAQAVRYAASLGFSIHNRVDPPAPSPSRELWLDATISKYPGREKIKVEIWNPPRISIGNRAAIINFHGGGWILGQGTDDARWAGAVLASLDAVVFTVNYRLAPSYPFPIPLEDCVDAICQIAARAAEFGIDPDSIVLSGFSAGANMTLASWIVLQDPSRFGYTLPGPAPSIAGLNLFYPLLDWTISRPEKRTTCTRPDLTLPKGMTDLIDASYIHPSIPRRERTDLRLSPGLMPDQMLATLPPLHLCLCEYDMLLAEGIRFANRLEAMGKTFSMRIVEGERHGWDNPPPIAPKESVGTEYGEAIQAIASWLGQSGDTDQESINSMKTKRPRLRRPKYLSLRSRSART
ncbi:Arylesterase [Paramyrothecium foliicola]|nr:Arylesterase [Paramyrothecium foliicola]